MSDKFSEDETIAEIASHYKAILELIGEDVNTAHLQFHELGGK